MKRYFVVGGAGSLEVAPGVKLIDTPQCPAAYKAEATKGGEFLELLRKDKELDWTFLSPSAVIAPGERTGKFRLGKEKPARGSQSGIDARGGAGPSPCPCLPCSRGRRQAAALPASVAVFTSSSRPVRTS